MSVSALRQCLYDPEMRIRILDYPSVQYPTILRMEVTNGFFDGITFRFHPGLNTILGGKGVGKSLVVEFLRFAMDQPSHSPDLVKDYESKLDKQLLLGGSVTVICQMPSGTTYSITRRYDGMSNPTDVTNLSTSSPYEGGVAKLMPVLAYSQSEVIDISRSSNIQLLLIDRLVDIDPHQREITGIREKLESNVNDYMGAHSAKDRVQDLDKDIATTLAQIEDLDKTLDHPLFKEKTAWDRRTSLIKQIDERATSVIEHVEHSLNPDSVPQIPAIAEEEKRGP